MKLAHINLCKLSVSKTNMRYAKRPPDVTDILPSVRKRGVIVPIIVRPNGGDDTYEIVAGSRRFRAAQLVTAETDIVDPMPCAIMEAGDDAAALEASLIENVQRRDADEVTQWTTFTRLIVKEGRSIEDIADTFAMPMLAVKRILALGNLLPRIRALYAKGEIDPATIRPLTLASKDKQKEWLALYDDPQAYTPSGGQVKAWLFGGQSIPTSAAVSSMRLRPPRQRRHSSCRPLPLSLPICRSARRSIRALAQPKPAPWKGTPNDSTASHFSRPGRAR